MEQIIHLLTLKFNKICDKIDITGKIRNCPMSTLYE